MSLPATAVATAVAAAVAHLLMRLAGRRYTGPAQATRKLRRDLLVGGLLSVVGTTAAVLLADGTVQPALRSLVAGPDLLVTVLTFWSYALCATAVVLAGYLGFLPAIRRTREIELGYATAGHQVGRWLVVASLLASTVAGVVFSVSLTPVTAAGAILALAVGVYAASPLLLRLSQSVRAPTPDEQRLLDRLCARVGADDYRLRVLERSEAEAAYALVRGPPGYRHLYVSDYLLDVLDEDAAAAMVGVAVENARHTTYRLVTVAAAGGVLLASIVAGRPVLALAALVGGVGVGYLVGRRVTFRADARVADRLGGETVADALEEVADVHDTEPNAGLFARLASQRPSLGQRIDRLRTTAE